MSLQQAFWVGAGILVLLFAAMAFAEFWIDRLWSRARHSQAKAHTGRWARRRDGSILPGAFGGGSRRPFRWYLERKSGVRVRSVSELCSWLKGCRYVPDQTRGSVDDHWQHPVDFEGQRQGDCEDHALWAWRKLREIGVPASLVVGELDSKRHVWVTFVENGDLFLLETTRKEDPVAFPAGEAARYEPAYGVDTGLETYVYESTSRRAARTGGS